MAQKGEVPVSTARHAARFWRRFTSYEFARHRAELPLVIDEILPAASVFPIAFRDSGEGPVPVALLRIGPVRETPFVSAEGRWIGSYVPSILRAHPFSAVAHGAEGKMMLLVDEESGLVTDDPRDEPFFAPDGALSESLQKVLNFLDERAASARRTRVACQGLRDAGVLTGLTPGAGMTEDEAAGLLSVDPDRLASLPDSDLPGMMHSGALRLAHAQLVALEHFARVSRAGRTAPRRAAERAPKPGAEDSLSGFLSALAEAQASDRENSGDLQ